MKKFQQVYTDRQTHSGLTVAEGINNSKSAIDVIQIVRVLRIRSVDTAAGQRGIDIDDHVYADLAYCQRMNQIETVIFGGVPH